MKEPRAQDQFFTADPQINSAAAMNGAPSYQNNEPAPYQFNEPDPIAYDPSEAMGAAPEEAAPAPAAVDSNEDVEPSQTDLNKMLELSQLCVEEQRRCLGVEVSPRSSGRPPAAASLGQLA